MAFSEQNIQPEPKEVEPQLRQVVKAIIKKGDEYLIVRKPDKAKYFPGFWDLPGGKVEPGEDSIAAIKREVAEETGGIAEIGDIAGVYEFDIDKQGKNDHCFTVYNAEVDPNLEPNESRQWATNEQISKLPFEPRELGYFNG